jgi:hypothetical protein
LATQLLANLAEHAIDVQVLAGAIRYRPLSAMTPVLRFQNLRASRETELAGLYPIHVVCSWIGNSAAIAAKHCLTVGEGDFERASKGGAKIRRTADAESSAATCRTRSHGIARIEARALRSYAR